MINVFTLEASETQQIVDTQENFLLPGQLMECKSTSNVISEQSITEQPEKRRNGM